MAMLLLQDPCPLVTMFKHKVITTDSSLIYMLCPITSSLLITSSILMTSYIMFSSPIRCQVYAGKAASKYIDEYCWATSTYSTSNLSPIYPGVGVSKGEEVVYRNYYQYMPLVLLLLAGLCMIPRILWRYWEAGLINKLVPVSNKKVAIDILNWKEVENYSKNIASYFVRNINGCHHMRYGKHNLMAEVLCLLIILLIIFLLQCFLKTFLQYVPDLWLHHSDAIPPEEKLFPLLSKCNIRKYGPTGSIETEDALCLLKVNLISQKVCLLIWLWLALLLIFTFLLLGNSFLSALLPSLRRKVLNKQTGGELASGIVYCLVDRLSYGDWLLVTRVCSHFTPDVVRSILTKLWNQAQ